MVPQSDGHIIAGVSGDAAWLQAHPTSSHARLTYSTQSYPATADITFHLNANTTWADGALLLFCHEL